MSRRLLVFVLALLTPHVVSSGETRKHPEGFPDHPIVSALEGALIAKHPVECAPLVDFPDSAVSVYRKIQGPSDNLDYVDQLLIEFHCSTIGGFVATLSLVLPQARTEKPPGFLTLPGPILLSYRHDDLRDLLRRRVQVEQVVGGFDAILEADPFFTKLKRYYETHHGQPGCWSWSTRPWNGGGSVYGMTGEVHEFREFLIDGRCGGSYSALFKGRYFPGDELVLFDEVVTLATLPD